MPIDDLFAEAKRQLNVCNSCRYCEGYCPVWPALEMRIDLSDGDVKHLSNLCHDCGDCFTACMYTAPHEFALNPPEVFSAVRLQTYRDYAWPSRPRWARGMRGIVMIISAVVVIVLALAVLLHNETASTSGSTASPYRLLPHWVLVGIVSVPVVWGVIAAVVAACRYWRDVHGSLRTLAQPTTWLLTLIDGFGLKYMRGGGAECTYPGEYPSSSRRRYHTCLVGGLLLCFLSTVAAGVQQEFLGWQPPYPFFSVPPLAGTLGGVAMIAGCTGLLIDKRNSDRELSISAMRQADYLLLSSLLVLAVTGLLTLALRTSPLFLGILVIHVVAVIACFAIAPYTKFMHFIYRLLSIYKYRLDSAGTG
jgi:citrate/tricarballylate utilization protein